MGECSQHLTNQVGRGLRLSPETGKVDCHIIDIVDSIDRAGGMLVSPTLFGLTHDELAEEMREKAEREDGAASGETSHSGLFTSSRRPRHVQLPTRHRRLAETFVFGEC